MILCLKSHWFVSLTSLISGIVIGNEVNHICDSGILPPNLISLDNITDQPIQINFTMRQCRIPIESITALNCYNATAGNDSHTFVNLNNKCEPLGNDDCPFEIYYSRINNIPSMATPRTIYWTNGDEVFEINSGCPFLDRTHLNILSEAVLKTVAAHNTKGIITFSAIERMTSKKINLNLKQFSIFIGILILFAIIAAVIITMEILRGCGKSRKSDFARKLSRINRITVK